MIAFGGKHLFGKVKKQRVQGVFLKMGFFKYGVFLNMAPFQCIIVDFVLIFTAVSLHSVWRYPPTVFDFVLIFTAVSPHSYSRITKYAFLQPYHKV